MSYSLPSSISNWRTTLIAIEAISTPGLHEKVLNLMETLPGVAVFDAPAGYGALTEKLLALGKQVTAADIFTGKFKVPENSQLKLLQLDFNDEHLPLADAAFDIVISVEGIEHLQCQWHWVRSLYRLLKPGGYLILSTPNILNFSSRRRYFLEGRYEHFKRPLVVGRSWTHDLENYHIAPVSYFELQFMLESSGFTIEEVHTNRCTERNLLSIAARPLFRMIYAYKNYRDKQRNRGDFNSLYATIMSDALFYGECVVVLARKPLVAIDGDPDRETGKRQSDPDAATVDN